MNALMGLLFISAMCIGLFGWLADRYDQWRWNRAHR